ncbi:MAG TPA: type I polyketide synthase, partial [Polyangiaceae bacterium]|nr:type I polyketide synthase [Polyangiaceae bacterium]
MALAGGVSVLVPQAAGYLRQADSIMSPDGHCRAFDAEGQGTIFGSGVGVVLLKRLADALRDRDPVLAVVLGGAMNNDGANKMGYSAPSLLGQSEAIAEALSAADVTPDAVGYVEAHGTATALGDPIEVAALARAFGGAPRAAKCAIGSVKSNFGHLDIASGIAGFIKAVLVVRHGTIPPSLHFKRPNPALNLDQTPFAVNAARRDWPDDGRPRRAGVSSFGIGGTNVHVVLEQPPAAAPRPPSREGAELLVLSAKTRPALDEATARLAAHLEARPDLALGDVAHTLGVGRRLFEERRFVVAADPADAIAALRSHGPPRLRTRRGGESAPRLVFAFPGQGSQYPNMGLALFRREEAFRADLRRCAELFERALGRDLLPLIYPPAGEGPSAGAALEAADVVQPALFAVEYALARQLERWGLRPAAVVGHSIGEYAAACFAGVFSLEDAVTAVALRSRLMAATAPGAMLAVPLDEAAARAVVGPELDLAAVNAPSLVVLSGRPEAVDAAETLLRQRGVETRRLRVQRANHSAAMTSVVEPFRQGLAKLAFAAPKVPLLSTVTAAWLDAKTA